MQNTAARKLKQVPEGCLVVGIDPHKKKHAAVVITQDLTIHDRFKFDNMREGLEFSVRRVRTEMVKSGCRGVMFAIETGGHLVRRAYTANRPSGPTHWAFYPKLYALLSLGKEHRWNNLSYSNTNRLEDVWIDESLRMK